MTEFFDQLRRFSSRVFEFHMGLPNVVSPWHYPRFSGGAPTGAILHFTSASDFMRAVRWFMIHRYGAEASANVVVADSWPEGWREEFGDGLPLVQALPTCVIQCVPPDKAAWHATWTNRTCYGIEIANAGEVRHNGDHWVWWRKGWTTEWRSDKEPVEACGRYWEPYSHAQLEAVVAVLAQVQAMYGTLKPYFVLGHEQVDRDKSDPGPLFPLHAVRSLALANPVYPASMGQIVPSPGEAVRDFVADRFCEAMGGPFAVAHDRVGAMSAALRNELWEPELVPHLTRAALKILGYHLEERWGGELGNVDVRSLRIFQRMMRIGVDGVVGPVTRRALVARLEERGYIGP